MYLLFASFLMQKQILTHKTNPAPDRNAREKRRRRKGNRRVGCKNDVGLNPPLPFPKSSYFLSLSSPLYMWGNEQGNIV